jgi:hypothetical protein
VAVDVLSNVKPPTTTGHVRTYASRSNVGRPEILDLSVALPVTTQEVAEGLAPTS